MKYRVSYLGSEILNIEELTLDYQGVIIHSSKTDVKIVVGNEQELRTALTALAVNTSKLDEKLGIELEEKVNEFKVQISNYPFDNTITRIAEVTSELDNKKYNQYHLNLTIKHYDSQNNHIAEMDKQLKMLAANDTQIEIDAQGNTVGEYKYLKMATEDYGIDPDVIKRETILNEDAKPIETNRFYKIYDI